MPAGERELVMGNLGRLWFGFFAKVTIATATWAVSSCSPTVVPVKEPPRCELQMVTLNIIASEHLNPTKLGQPRPVQLRIYQLMTDTRLLNASFEEIWKQEEETLKDDLVKVDELSIYPNTRTEVKFERDESAQVVAGAALFRTPTGRTWYYTFELPPAPAEGECGQECKDGECEGPELNPKFFFWLEDTRIDDGAEHADEYPRGKTQVEKYKLSQPKAQSSEPPPATGDKP